MKSKGSFLFWIVGTVGVVAGITYLVIMAPYWSSRREHAQLIEKAFNARLLPACAFIRDFVEREHRLPSDIELESINRGKSGWDIVTLIRERPSWLETWGTVGRDFVVTTSEPEWTLYYCSWNNKRIESWTD